MQLPYTVSYHLLSTPNVFLHLWSLSVEEQFYLLLLWPLALLLGFACRAAALGSRGLRCFSRPFFD
jgi:peptidoglycan/LPS O-acetylase OafA/YrhL